MPTARTKVVAKPPDAVEVRRFGYHDMTVLGLPYFVKGAMQRLPNVLKAAGKKSPHALKAADQTHRLREALAALLPEEDAGA